MQRPGCFPRGDPIVGLQLAKFGLVIFLHHVFIKNAG